MRPPRTIVVEGQVLDLKTGWMSPTAQAVPWGNEATPYRIEELGLGLGLIRQPRPQSDLEVDVARAP